MPDHSQPYSFLCGFLYEGGRKTPAGAGFAFQHPNHFQQSIREHRLKDADNVHRQIAEIPTIVSNVVKYQNAMKTSTSRTHA